MAYSDPEKRRAYEREYQRKWRRRFPEKAKARGRERYARNRERIKEQVKARHRANPDQRKGWVLKALYGLSVEQYNERLEAQGGLCILCRHEDPKGYALAVDHEHETGMVRGLLCSKCNAGIALFNEDPDLLMLAAGYLQFHKTAKAA